MKKKKQVKLTGKDHAKLNKRKKFYEKLERYFNKDSKQIILIRMNKGISFPEYDELSIRFKDDYVELESEINFEEIKTIDINYYEEAHYLIAAMKLKHLNIVRKETLIDNQGNERRGQSGADENYNYVHAYNWGIQTLKAKALLTVLEKEKNEPTIYDLTPIMAVPQEAVYRKSSGPPKRRRR